MNSEQIKTFIACADAGSFSKAEESCYMSKQAILKQINRLEEELQFSLFERTKNGIRLTEAGKKFYTGAKRLLSDQDSLIKECRKTAGSSFIRIGSVEHQVLLDPVNEAFAKMYPEIRLQKIVHPNHSGEYRVSQNLMDVGETFVIDTVIPENDFTYTKLTTVPYCAGVGKNHPLAKKKTVSLKELSDYETVIMPMMIMKSFIEEIHEAFAKKPQNLIESMDVDHQVDMAFSCIAEGKVFLTANPFAASIDELVLIPLKEGWTREYGMIYKTPVSDAVQKYIDLALNIYQK